jgi:hypothetical protein
MKEALNPKFIKEIIKGEVVCSEYGCGLYAASQFLYDSLTTFSFFLFC